MSNLGDIVASGFETHAYNAAIKYDYSNYLDDEIDEIAQECNPFASLNQKADD